MSLFPESLRVTDPEFTGLFDRFARQEVPAHGDLPDRSRFVVVLGSLIAQHTLTQYQVTLEAALDAGLTPVEAKEIVYQTVPYVGIGRGVEALNATNQLLKARDVTLPLPGQSTTDPESRQADGLALQKSIFGDGIARNYANAPASQLHIQQFLSANCFGDYYTRTGLDIPTRELLTFAVILSLGGAEPQVKGHIFGNLQVGNGKAVLLAAVTQLIPYIGYPRALNAIAALNEVSPEEQDARANL